MRIRYLSIILVSCLLMALTGSCMQAAEQPAAQPPVQIEESVLAMLNELAQVKSVQPTDSAELQASRTAAMRKAKDALLDATKPFNGRVTIACWLQGMGDPLSDKIINGLANDLNGEANPDPRIIYALGMLAWNYAQQASADPFRWKGDSKAGVFAKQSLELFNRASDTEPDNGLFTLTVAYADFFNTGRLNGTLISWNWKDDVQREAALRIAPLLKRFAESKGGGGITGPPYFTPLVSWKEVPQQETVGGLYDGVVPSALLPACAVLVARDCAKNKKPEDILTLITASEKLLSFVPEKYDRLTAAAISARELAQTVELVMVDPSKRGDASALTEKARGLFKSITDDWINNVAPKYSKIMGKDQAATIRIEKNFVGKYKGSVLSQLKRLRDFVSTLKPEDMNTDPPPAPW
jgi:hypothetical protein